MADKTILTFQIDPELEYLIIDYLRGKDMSRSQLIRYALREYLSVRNK